MDSYEQVYKERTSHVSICKLNMFTQKQRDWVAGNITQRCNREHSNYLRRDTAHGLIIFPHPYIHISCYFVPILKKKTPREWFKCSSLQAIVYFSFKLKLLSFFMQYVITGRRAEGVKKAYLFSIPNPLGYHHEM
jgi:hypothetical protein